MLLDLITVCVLRPISLEHANPDRARQWWPHSDGASEQSEFGERSELNKMIWLDGRLTRWTYRTNGMSTMHMGHFLMISNDNHRSIRVGNEEIMLSKSENFTKILKIMNTMFTNSAVLRPAFSASFQYQQEVLLDELLYQLVLYPKVLRNNRYVIF